MTHGHHRSYRRRPSPKKKKRKKERKKETHPHTAASRKDTGKILEGYGRRWGRYSSSSSSTRLLYWPFPADSTIVLYVSLLHSSPPSPFILQPPPTGFTGFWLGFTGFHWDQEVLYWMEPVLMRFTWFLLCYCGVFFSLLYWKRSQLPGFTGFYWVLMRSTGIYRVLMALRGKMGLTFDQVSLSRDEIYQVFSVLLCFFFHFFIGRDHIYWVLLGFIGLL